MASPPFTRNQPWELGITLLLWLLPLLVTALWIGWAWGHVARYEAAITPRSGMAYAVFVQLGHAWTQGWGWVQTAHPNYVDHWHWGGHYGVIWLGTAKLAALGDSPWTLARIQVAWIGLGCMSAWLLGRAEGRIAGGPVGLLLYAGAGGIATIALDDYQDLALCLPLIPLVVWAARHGPWWGFVLAALALATVREELWLLLPLAGLTRNIGRGVLGALVALAWYGLLCGLSPILWEPPPLFQLGATAGAVGPTFDPSRLDLRTQLDMVGGALPFFLLQPACALAALGTAIFHAQPELRGVTGGMAFPHHYAPMVGFAVAGAAVVLGRLARMGRTGAVLALTLAVGSTAWALQRSAPELHRELRRDDGRVHPAWALLADVPDEGVLYVPSLISPAAAQRRWLAHEQSVPARVPPERITHAVVPAGCGFEGAVLATHGGWMLLEAPSGLPAAGDPVPWSRPREGGPVRCVLRKEPEFPGLLDGLQMTTE